MLISAALVVGIGISGIVMIEQSDSANSVEVTEEPPPRAAQPEQAEPEGTESPPTEPKPEPALEPAAAPEPEPEAVDVDELPSATAEPEPEPVVLKHAARVVSSVGNRVKQGVPCVVSTHVLAGRITDLDVTCASDSLYDTRTPLNGMARVGGQVFERAGKSEAEWRYRLQYSDTGARSQRTQVSLNSLNRAGSVFSESTDAFRVELRLAEFSLPRQGVPLFETPRDVMPLRSSAKVEATDGSPPKVRESCSLEARYMETGRQGPRCKTELRCGREVLYGKGNAGHGPCDIRDGRIVGFRDGEETHEDGDPKIDIDVDEGAVTVSDSPNRQSFSISLRLGN